VFGSAGYDNCAITADPTELPGRSAGHDHSGTVAGV